MLPKGFHRIRHYGLLATSQRADTIERARELLGVAPPEAPASDDTTGADLPPCPCCGARQRIIETFLRGQMPRHRASARPLVFKADTS